MSKVKEFYDNWDNWHSGKKLDHASGRNARTPAASTPNQRKKRAGRFDDFEGQMSFISDDGVNLRIDPEEEKYRLRADRRKEDVLAYYDAFYNMLNKYGKLNVCLNLQEAIIGARESGTPMSETVRNTLNYHYEGDEDRLNESVNFARKHLKDARRHFTEKALAVGLDDPEINRYVAEYRDKDRRDRYRKMINKERAKVFSMEPAEVLEGYDLWRPYDFEADYQILRSKRQRNAEAIASGEKKPRKKPTKNS